MSRQAVTYFRGGQREGSPHYVFLDEESIGEENISLQSVSRSVSKLRKIEVINLQVKPDDTLQALALRYRCTISALKQINKIDKENEMYAKPYIKVPVQPFSILTETLTDSQECDTNVISTRKEESISLNAASKSAESSSHEINTIILNSVCVPSSSHSNGDEDSYMENDRLLDDAQSTESAGARDVYSCSGDDCGLSLGQLILCIFLIVVVVPIIYTYIYKTRMIGHVLTNNNVTVTG